jgi:hypothetical protein
MRLHLFYAFLLGFCSMIANAQGVGDGWMRVQTDNGEVSFDMPSEHSYFIDRDGFTVSKGDEDFKVSQMQLLNAYRDSTLISFEAYRVNPSALDALVNVSITRGTTSKSTHYKGTKVREVRKTGKSLYFISYYFKSGEHVYVVSAASRTGETPVMQRFLDSLSFLPRARNPSPNVASLSSLQVSPITVRQSLPTTPTYSPRVAEPSDPDGELVIASLVRATYLDKARNNSVTGAVRLRMEMAPNGYIPSIEVLNALSHGLTSQAIKAALRIKFLPELRDGKPVSRKKTLEYTFAIY